MKKIKKYSALFAGLAMMLVTMTSCNESSSYQPLTPQEIQTAFYTVRGMHVGKLKYYVKDETVTSTSATKEMTTDISWSIDTDSTMTIYGFPTAAFADFVSNEEAKQALLLEPNQTLSCKILFDRSSYGVFYYIGLNAATYNITYGGKQHKVQVAFWQGGNYSYGLYSTASKINEMQIVIGGVYIDDAKEIDGNFLTTTNIPLFFTTSTSSN